MATTAEELRAAAARLRTLAANATPGPWRQHDTHLGQYGHTATVLSGDGNSTDLRAWLPTMSHEYWDQTRNAWNDAAYIAVMHPGVGSALADTLEAAADDAEMCDRINNRQPDNDGATRVMYLPTTGRALTVAHLINQEQP